MAVSWPSLRLALRSTNRGTYSRSGTFVELRVDGVHDLCDPLRWHRWVGRDEALEELIDHSLLTRLRHVFRILGVHPSVNSWSRDVHPNAGR